jgi:hypothetical protein
MAKRDSVPPKSRDIHGLNNVERPLPLLDRLLDVGRQREVDPISWTARDVILIEGY